jgi:branched-chain amino acid transport system substrate-binding protein
MKKIIYIVIALVIVIGAFTYFSRPQEQGQDIVLGSVISLTGPAASFGEYAKNAMDLAVQEINAKGGIEGRIVRIIHEDDETDPKAAVSAFNKLKSIDHVQGVIGGLWDFVAQPLIPLAQNTETPYITPSQFRIEGSFEFNEQSFTMLTDFENVIRELTTFLKRSETQKIAVVHFTSTFGNEIARTISEVANEIGKGPIVDEAYTAFNTNDFKTTIAKLKQQNVDTVFLDMVDADTVNFLIRSKELGFNPAIITYVGAYDGFKPEQKSLLENVIVLNWEGNNAKFTQKYQTTYGVPPAKSASRAYDAIYVLAEALAQSQNPAHAAEYIVEHTFTTINGDITFLPGHQLGSIPFVLEVVKNGSLVALP